MSGCNSKRSLVGGVRRISLPERMGRAASLNTTMISRSQRFHCSKFEGAGVKMCSMGGQVMLDDFVKKKIEFVLACNQMLDIRF